MTDQHELRVPKTSDQADSTPANRRLSRSSHQQRLIYFQGVQTHKFCNNSIHTAKYNVISFFPKFLFEQFRKYANVFFLIIVLLQQIENVSPTGRYTTAVPFIMILLVSASKEIFEDIKRHRADRKVNHTKTRVLNKTTAEFERKRWMTVQVGDIVECVEGDFFPADMLLLSTSEANGLCYVETANLDGETNLKIRQSLNCTYQMRTSDQLVEQLQFAQIDCEPPNGHLYEFNGNLKLEGQIYQISPNQILLRGAKLKNTRWSVGVVLYTGHESKLMLNTMRRAPLKQSALEKFTNSHMIYLLVILLFMGLISTVFSVMHNRSYDGWYLQGFSDLSSSFGFTFLTFVILYNNLIPISLQVSLEIVRFVQALFINWDTQMYCEESDTPAGARTSNLNEELGQVSYILSDKTGTLTRNVMEFKQCSIAGKVYDEEHTKDINGVIQERGETWRLHQEFMQVLSVCHTVVPEVKTEGEEGEVGRSPNGNQFLISTDQTDRVPTALNTAMFESKKVKKIVYQAASPDEGALVSGAAEMGFEFTARTPQRVQVQALGQMLEFELLHVIEFDSTRKRMSVIIRDLADGGRIKIYCKGADSVIYERLCSQKAFAEQTLKHLEDFATLGLRTLCIAWAELGDNFYNEWQKKYQMALKAPIAEREQKVGEVMDLVENNLQLLGASAIEDKLQEGVPEAIETLLSAGIRFWILTGDKQETAINIGHSCRLLQSGQTMLLVSNAETEADVRKSLESAKQTMRTVFGSESMLSGINTRSGTVDVRLSKRILDEEDYGNRKASVDNDDSKGSDVPCQANGYEISLARARCSLVVDGTALKFALLPTIKPLFLEVALRCHSVICCRVSPKQKADVVQMVKDQKLTGRREITLAIGDGANDVAMIRAAHVGIGISGKEGLQAANSADYSIGQFRFLVRLLLIHGSYSLTRLAKLILYSFYKNIALYVIELWFAGFSAWSGQTIFERWTIGLYNVLFTMAPPLAIGLFERPCEERLLLQKPCLYSQLSAEMQSGPLFWQWVGDALLHSVILFFMTYAAVQGDALWGSGLSDGGYLVFGNMLYTYVVLTVCVKAGLESRCWTVPLHFAIWGSVASWFIFLTVYSKVWPTLPMASEMRGIATMTYSSGVFWVGLVLIPLTALLPDIVRKSINHTVWPTQLDRILLLKKQHAALVSNDSFIEPRTLNAGTDNIAADPNAYFLRSLFSQVTDSLRVYCGFSRSRSTGGAVSGRLRRRRSSGLLIEGGSSLMDSSGQPPLSRTPHSSQPTDGSPLHFEGTSTTVNVRRPVSITAATSTDQHQPKPGGSSFTKRPSLTPENQLQDELRYGFAFSQEEHGAVPQSQLIRAYGQSKDNP